MSDKANRSRMRAAVALLRCAVDRIVCREARSSSLNRLRFEDAARSVTTRDVQTETDAPACGSILAGCFDPPLGIDFRHPGKNCGLKGERRSAIAVGRVCRSPAPTDLAEVT